MDPPLTITPETTIYETLQLMKQNNKQSYGVVNQKGQLLGMVTRSDLSRVGLGDTAAAIQLLKDTPLDYIAKTIRGFFAYRDEEYHFNGKVSIIAMTETGLNDYDIRDRLVMLGNDTEAQKAAIRKGGRHPGRRLDKGDRAGSHRAGQSASLPDHHLRTRHDETLPVICISRRRCGLIMLKSLVSFNMDEFVEDVGKKMLKSRYRQLPRSSTTTTICADTFPAIISSTIATNR